jgi:hypothetical protein
LNAITLTFVGLIAHVLTMGNVQRAVFVNAPMHNARIVASAVDVIEASGLVEEPWSEAGQRAFSLNGQHMTLETGTSDATVAEASFARYVPSLAAISDATEIRDEVEDGVLFEGVHAYLDLHGGRLSAADGTTQQATFPGSRFRSAQCVAMSVTYTAESAGDSVVLRGSDGALLRLRAGATARVINDPPPSFTTPHYHMYSMILKDATYVSSPRATGKACATDGRERPGAGRLKVSSNALAPKLLITDVNCSNSSWP